jgi:hypothetical protein
MYVHTRCRRRAAIDVREERPVTQAVVRIITNNELDGFAR